MKATLRLAVACVGIAFAALAAAQAAATPDDPRVRIAQGEIEGTAQAEVDAFLGIPCARTPVGDRRWRPPAAPLPWQGVRPAREKTGSRLVSPVPVISGYMADEGFVMGRPATTPASFEAHVRQRYSAAAGRFLALYPHADDAQATASLALIARDRFMASLAIWALRRAKSEQAVYGYRWDRPVPDPDATRFGAFHTGEVPCLFAVLDRRTRPWRDLDDAVSQALQHQVLAFAAGGRPAAPWLPLAGSLPGVLALGEGASATMVAAVPDARRLQAFVDCEAAGGTLTMF